MENRMEIYWEKDTFIEQKPIHKLKDAGYF